MNVLTKIWSGIEKNRWSVIVPVIGFILWIVVGFSCTAITESPVRSNSKVNALQLEQDYETWLANVELTSKRFEYAVKDIENQQERLNDITKLLMKLASGNVTSYVGLLNIVFASGLLGVSADNVRKNGVIAGLKRNKKSKTK